MKFLNFWNYLGDGSKPKETSFCCCFQLIEFLLLYLILSSGELSKILLILGNLFFLFFFCVTFKKCRRRRKEKKKWKVFFSKKIIFFETADGTSWKQLKRMNNRLCLLPQSTFHSLIFYNVELKLPRKVKKFFIISCCSACILLRIAILISSLILLSYDSLS